MFLVMTMKMFVTIQYLAFSINSAISLKQDETGRDVTRLLINNSFLASIM